MKKVKLGDVCRVVSGSTPKSNVAEYWDGNIKWITPAEINEDSYIIKDTERHITELAVKKTNLNLLPIGTVLLSSRAPIGKIAIAGAEMYCNQGFKNLICSDKIYNRYLFFFLASKKDYLNALGRGATFKEISKSIVENVEIPLPPISEQTRIVAILEKINAAIANRQQNLTLLDELVKSRYIEMFGDVYEHVALKDICKIITDGTHQPPKFVNKGIPFLFVSNIAHNYITYEAEKFISEETYNGLIKRTPIEKGDVLLSIVGSYGHPAVVEKDDKFLFQRHIAYLKPDKEKINSYYLHATILSDEIKHKIDACVKGIAQKTLNLSEIKKMVIPLPPLALQNKFAEFVHRVDDAKAAVHAQADALSVLRDKLMQDYFG